MKRHRTNSKKSIFATFLFEGFAECLVLFTFIVIIIVALLGLFECFGLFDHIFDGVLGRILTGVSKGKTNVVDTNRIALFRHLLESIFEN